MGFNTDRTVYVVPTWTEFRTYLDGTIASLAFFTLTRPEYYRIVTEEYGGMRLEHSIVRDGGASDVDFTTNFSALVPRLASQQGMDKILYDLEDPTINYIGRAPIGTATAAAAWRIKRLSFTNGNPSGTVWSGPTAIWDNRATEPYS